MSEFQTSGLGEEARKVPCKVIVPSRGGHGSNRPTVGLVQDNPADRMTGAHVVMLAGVLATRPDWDGVVCLVGERTVWAHLSAGEVVSFASFVSVALAQHLRAVAEDGFDAGLAVTLSRPERLAAELAQADVTPGRAWGALIGAELAASRPYWLGQEVVIVGDWPVEGFYARALEHQGVTPQKMTCFEAFEAGRQALSKAQSSNKSAKA